MRFLRPWDSFFWQALPPPWFVCSVCGSGANFYYSSFDGGFDAIACRTCAVWYEPTCDDPECEFCVPRPDIPTFWELEDQEDKANLATQECFVVADGDDATDEADVATQEILSPADFHDATEELHLRARERRYVRR